MSSDKPSSSAQPKYADRVYRSAGAIAGGVLLLALAGWLGIDALVRGDGRTKLLAVSGLLLAVPLVAAFTVRPAVYAGDDRLRVRNPFRSVVLPWASVEGLRSGYSNEVLADGKKYQLWAIPVSIRARNKANRRASRDRARDVFGQPLPEEPHRAEGDKSMDELRDLLERNAERETAQGTPTTRWAYEIAAPAVVGLVMLVVLLLV
jgi:Bacterial PH domain